MKAIDPGWYFCPTAGKFIYNLQHEYSTLEPDLRNMSIVRDVANWLDPAIQLTIKVPSLNANKRLPVLDIELSIVQNKIEFISYKKAVRNPRVMLYSTAISNRIKRDSILQEG